MIDEYVKRLQEMKKHYIEGSLKKTDFVKRKEVKEKSISSDKEKHDDLILSEQLLNEASKEARRNSKEILEEIVTRGLQVTYGENVQMRVKLNEKKNPVTASIEVLTEYADGINVNDPKDADGGGMADMMSLASFIGFNYLHERNKMFISLDEPTKYLSDGYSSLDVAKFLFEVSVSLEKQIFLITHDKTLMQAGDKNFLFELDANGVSQVIDKKEIT